MRPTTSRAVAFLMLLALLCYVFLMKLTAIPIRIWDEARLANSALHMHLHGNWLIPHYDGAPDMWSVKPPLMIWVQALMMKIIGVNEFAVRLPAALASILTGLSVFWFCTRTMRRTWLAYIAGAVFATTFAYAYLHAGRYGEYDGLLVLFTTLSCFCMYLHI
ncbi:MAG TPA: glycosyltransferase family 39 protein, partial [Flavisolibacter sp.]